MSKKIKQIETEIAENLDKKCRGIAEKEFFELQLVEKTFDVFVNCTPYDFKPFTRKNRPQGAGCILKLIKKKSFKKDQYRVVVRTNTTIEMIQTALARIVLPF